MWVANPQADTLKGIATQTEQRLRGLLEFKPAYAGLVCVALDKQSNAYAGF